MITRQPIPIIGSHRGVGLHDQQDEARLAAVRKDIDAVYEIQESLVDLKEWAANHSKSPESRLLAAALLRAQFEQAVDERRARPDVDLDWLASVVAGLDNTRQPECYDSIWAPRSPRHYPNRAVGRSRRLVD